MIESLLVSLASASMVSVPLFIVLPRLKLDPHAQVLFHRLALLVVVFAFLPCSMNFRVDLPPGMRGSSASLWQGFTGWLIVLWTAGLAISLARAHIAHHRWSRGIGTLAPAPADVTGKVRDLAVEMRCPIPVVMCSQSIRLPAVPLRRRPMLLISREILDDDVLRHELAHIRGRDVHWFLAMRLLSATLWFLPLVWKFEQAFLLAHEVRADAVAAPKDGLAYAKRLLRVAPTLPEALNASFGSYQSHLEARIAAIRQPTKSQRLAITIGIMLVGAALAIGVELPAQRAPSTVTARSEKAIPVVSLRASL